MDLTRTELSVLGLLAWGGERTGYELHKLARRTIAFVWAPARSQLYSVLPRLEAAGLARSRHVAQAARPDKRIFAITEAGREALRAWLETVEPIEPDDRDGLMLKLFFGAQAPPDATVRQLEDFRGRVRARLATYREIEAEIEATRAAAADHDDHPLQTLRLGIALAEATLAWADETLAAQRTRSSSQASTASRTPGSASSATP